jgi:hypothetical protein
MDLNLLPYGIAILAVIPTILVLVYVYKLLSKPKFQGPPLQGSARVLSVQSTGTMINQRYVCRIALGVEVPGRGAYTVEVREPIHPLQMAGMQSGAAFPVLVDSANAQNVRVDFNQPIRPPQAGYSG